MARLQKAGMPDTSSPTVMHVGNRSCSTLFTCRRERDTRACKRGPKKTSQCPWKGENAHTGRAARCPPACRTKDTLLARTQRAAEGEACTHGSQQAPRARMRRQYAQQKASRVRLLRGHSRALSLCRARRSSQCSVLGASGFQTGRMGCRQAVRQASSQAYCLHEAWGPRLRANTLTHPRLTSMRNTTASTSVAMPKYSS
jgi:hypothetical protein